MNDRLNVRQCGALGDGRTDDTRALQAAIDAAGEGEGTVYFPPGVYLTSMLNVHDHMALVADPAWAYYVPAGAILKLADPAAPCLLDLTTCRGTTLDGLCLIGDHLPDALLPAASRRALTHAQRGENLERALAARAGKDPAKAGPHGLWVGRRPDRTREDHNRIERCMVMGFTGDGMHFEHLHCFSIRGCSVGNNAGNGLWMYGADGYILDNWFSGNGGAGIRVTEGFGSTTITANRIEWNRGGGLVASRLWQANITGNYFDRAGGPGLWLRDNGPGCYNIAVTGNIVNRSGRPAWTEAGAKEDANVILEACRGLTFTGNSISAGADDDGKGGNSPAVGLVLRDLRQSVAAQNVMWRGATRELIHDLGGHEDLVLANNPGSLLAAGG